MDIHQYVIQSRPELGSKSYIFMENDKIISPELGSKSYIFMENDKIISLANLLQYLLSAEILSEWKIEFILPYLVRKFQNQCMEQTNSKVPSKYSPIIQGLILDMAG